MSSNGEERPKNIIDDEVELIMHALSQKGDVVPNLKELLADKAQITTDGIKLKQVFLEIILTKFGTVSLEHVSRGIEKVKPIFDDHYKGQADAQKMAIETLFKAFNMDQLSAQDFSKENLFQLRDKVVKLVMRLNQLEIIDTQVAIDWCLDQLEAFKGQVQLTFTHCHLILSLIQKLQSQAEHIVTIYAQEYDKPAEVKIETPYEQRMREQAEAENMETKSVEEKKEKTPDEISAERAHILSTHQAMFARSLTDETEILEHTLLRMTKIPSLDQLTDKVILLSRRFKQTGHVSSSVKHPLIIQ